MAPKSELAVVEKSELAVAMPADIDAYWGIPAGDDSVMIPPAPFQVRLDCQIGALKMPDNTRLGDSAEIFLIQPPRYFWGYLGSPTNDKGEATHTDWVQIMYVPAPGCKADLPARTVCVSYLKTQTKGSFDTVCMQAWGAKVANRAIYSLDKFEPQKTKDGKNYYFGKWSYRLPQSVEEVSLLTNGVLPLVSSKVKLTDPGEKTLIVTREFGGVYLSDDVVNRMKHIAAQDPTQPIELIAAMAQSEQIEDEAIKNDAPF